MAPIVAFLAQEDSSYCLFGLFPPLERFVCIFVRLEREKDTHIYEQSTVYNCIVITKTHTHTRKDKLQSKEFFKT